MLNASLDLFWCQWSKCKQPGADGRVSVPFLSCVRGPLTCFTALRIWFHPTFMLDSYTHMSLKVKKKKKKSQVIPWQGKKKKTIHGYTHLPHFRETNTRNMENKSPSIKLHEHKVWIHGTGPPSPAYRTLFLQIQNGWRGGKVVDIKKKFFFYFLIVNNYLNWIFVGKRLLVYYF